MDITWYLFVILVFLMSKTNKSCGVISSKFQYLNYFLLTIIVSLSGYGINGIIWALLNINNISTYFKNYVYMPQWLNVFMWISLNIVDCINLILSYYMIQRNEKARKLFILILPISVVTFFYEIVRNVYAEVTKSTLEWYIWLGIVLVISLIVYLPMYLFYKSKKIRNILFIVEKNKNI